MDLALESARAFAALGHAVYPARGENAHAGAKAAATTDKAVIERVHDDGTDWRVRTEPGDKLWCVRLHRQRDIDLVVKDTGSAIPLTWEFCRPNSLSRTLLFAQTPTDPRDFDLNGRCWRGAHAKCLRSTALPGSLWRGRGAGLCDRWRWRPGCSIADIEPAPLPPSWLPHLPRVVQRLPFVERDQFNACALHSRDLLGFEHFD